MKRIITALIICTLLLAVVLAIPASAATPREQLKEQLDIATAYEGTNYSKATWDHLQNTIKSAQEAYDNANASDLIINMQVSALKSAIAGLKVDTTAIDVILAEIDAVKTASDDIKKMGYSQGDYTEASWATLQEAVTEAKTAIASNDIEVVKAGAVALQAAFDKLEYNPVPTDITKKLADLLDLYERLVPEDYSDSAWGMVVIKVEQAEATANDKRLSANVIAATQLETALKNLTEDKVLPTPPVLDCEYIDGLFAHIDSLPEDMFTPESWAELREAYDAAKKVRETAKQQSEINDASVKLYAAQEKLVLAPKPTETDPPATEAPVATQAPAEEPAGCGGTIAIGATVVVAVLGTAIVLKKKEN